MVGFYEVNSEMERERRTSEFSDASFTQPSSTGSKLAEEEEEMASFLLPNETQESYEQVQRRKVSGLDPDELGTHKTARFWSAQRKSRTGIFPRGKSVRLVVAVLLLLCLVALLWHFSCSVVQKPSSILDDDFPTKQTWSTLETSQRACSEATRNSQFDDFTSSKQAFWTSLSREDRARYKSDLDAYIASLKKKEWKKPTPNDPPAGIIYSAHPGSLHWTLISLSFLRETGSTLPVEIYHLGELVQEHVTKLESISNVRVIDLKKSGGQTWDFQREPDGKLVSFSSHP